MVGAPSRPFPRVGVDRLPRILLLVVVALLAGCAGSAPTRSIRRIAVLPVENRAGRTFQSYADRMRARVGEVLAERGYDVVPAAQFDLARVRYPGEAPEDTTLVPAVDSRKLSPLDGYVTVLVSREENDPPTGCTVRVALYRMPDRPLMGQRGDDARVPIWSNARRVEGNADLTGEQADARSLCASAPVHGTERRP